MTVASTVLPRIEYSLVGMTFGMLVYVYLTFTCIPSVDLGPYLEQHTDVGG